MTVNLSYDQFRSRYDLIYLRSFQKPHLLSTLSKALSNTLTTWYISTQSGGHWPCTQMMPTKKRGAINQLHCILAVVNVAAKGRKCAEQTGHQLMRKLSECRTRSQNHSLFNRLGYSKYNGVLKQVVRRRLKRESTKACETANSRLSQTVISRVCNLAMNVRESQLVLHHLFIPMALFN